MKINNHNIGLGLRNQHLQYVIDNNPAVDFFEVHSENFFYDNLASYQLETISKNYPLSMHSVGLSLGSADNINTKHLTKLKNSIEKFKPSLISEHLSFSSINGNYINDLLPIPYTTESFANFTDKVKQTQDFLGRQILIENPSSYLQFKNSSMSEWEFFANLPNACGCGLLLDVNNVFVSCFNHNYDAHTYIDAINPNDVLELHLAGHTQKTLEQGVILIDDHGSQISEEVLELYQHTTQKFGNIPALIEWDSNIPEFSVLANEIQRVQKVQKNAKI